MRINYANASSRFDFEEKKNIHILGVCYTCTRVDVFIGRAEVAIANSNSCVTLTARATSFLYNASKIQTRFACTILLLGL